MVWGAMGNVRGLLSDPDCLLVLTLFVLVLLRSAK